MKTAALRSYKFALDQLATAFVLAGFGVLLYGAFSYSTEVGFIALGIALAVLGITVSIMRTLNKRTQARR